MFRFLLTFCFYLFSLTVFAQFIISGSVKDDITYKFLEGATIQLNRYNYFAITNDQGRYEIVDVPEGSYSLLVKFLGYEDQKIQLQVTGDVLLDIVLSENVQLTDEIIVYATRASEKSPTTFTNLNKIEIQKQNFGQDLPFVLNWTPSLVTTSDAGAGVGYTGLRVRGSDATRVNVTLNGIPMNDSESQGVFWVNIPDIATSTQSIQIQRGVGTSTNGPGAFGASINLNTNQRRDEAYADVINSYGTFDTRRHTIGFGSGLVDNRFTFDGRASLIKSDGFIDRASSDLKSFYLSSGFYGDKTMIKAIVFGGNEVTYQSWYGIPESRLNNDVAGMMTTTIAEGWNQEQTANFLNSNSRTFNTYTYKNQVDNYSQDHYQLHISHRFGPHVIANVALHYTYGRGYFEEFKYDQLFEGYGIQDAIVGTDTVTNTDLIRRRWLDNDFYGATYSISYEKGKYKGVLGGGANTYKGDHFGEVLWAQIALTVPKDYKYYNNSSKKSDFNIFWKSNYHINARLNGFIDLQYRRINYEATGIENNLATVDINTDFNFFNPKAGLTYELSKGSRLYTSYGIAQREPVRNDFIDSPVNARPRPEKMQDLEVGWRLKKPRYSFNLNYYMMAYKDQLVLTGALNDVGASIRTNVDKSYRTGIELEGLIRLNRKLSFGGNLTLSENKIRNFTEILYDYGLNFDEFNEVQNQLRNVDISFSPAVIAGSNINYSPIRGFESTLFTKYVGEQFLDNTSNASRKIDSYLINDLRLSYSFQPAFMKSISVSLLTNNIFDVKYESNGYTWGYIGGSNTVRQNYYYPQAGRNYLVMVSLKF